MDLELDHHHGVLYNGRIEYSLYIYLMPNVVHGIFIPGASLPTEHERLSQWLPYTQKSVISSTT